MPLAALLGRPGAFPAAPGGRVRVLGGHRVLRWGQGAGTGPSAWESAHGAGTASHPQPRGWASPVVSAPCVVRDRGCDQGHRLRRWQSGDWWVRGTLPHCLSSCPTHCTLAAPSLPPGPCPTAPTPVPPCPALAPCVGGRIGPQPPSPWWDLQHPMGLPPATGSPRASALIQPLPCLSFPTSLQICQHLVSTQAAGVGNGAINDAN